MRLSWYRIPCHYLNQRFARTERSEAENRPYRLRTTRETSALGRGSPSGDTTDAVRQPIPPSHQRWATPRSPVQARQSAGRVQHRPPPELTSPYSWSPPLLTDLKNTTDAMRINPQKCVHPRFIDYLSLSNCRSRIQEQRAAPRYRCLLVRIVCRAFRNLWNLRESASRHLPGPAGRAGLRCGDAIVLGVV